MTQVYRTKDFWAGAIYVAIGLAAVWLGRSYPFGTSSRMGAGYFPLVLGWLLAGVGLLSLARAFLRHGEAVGGIAWKSLVLIIGATLAFAYLLERAGLVIALLAMALGSAAASQYFRFDPKAVLGLVGLIAVCAAVFVTGLGVPMPLLGSWFGR